jgi:predicted ATPase
MILTPDQRLRVFVSSTLVELAAEREAVRRAVEALELTPVMFELGARPHPPRTLYRAYLEQSHVFVAIYWQRYGWIAPDMQISGLEDEYELSGRLPRLVYVKEPAPDRETKLVGLVARIEHEGETSYRTFTSTGELEELVRRDLMTLMTERFREAGTQAPAAPASLPAPTTPILGRDDETAALSKLITADGARLVTLTGPGGVGKTRLALEVAASCREHFSGAVFFVPLAAVEDPARVPIAVARALRANPAGKQTEVDAIRDFFGDRGALLVLDNFEQVTEAAPLVTELLSSCPGLVALVTSRAVLRLGGEHEFPVDPLGVPADGPPDSLSEYESVRLFIARARAARPDFRMDDQNAAAVAEICRRLDGLPLAIELAAARVKLLPPALLLERLDAGLEVVSGGRRDAPERHQALRNAVLWSYELLTPEEKELFARLGVFTGSFTLEAVEAVCTTPGALDAVDGLSSLIEKSLVRGDPAGRTPGFQMLRTIRDFAVELLDASGIAADARRKHARYYLERARAAQAGFRGPDQAAWSAELEGDNFHAAFEWSLEQGDVDALADAGWALWIFWFVAGTYLREGRRLMDRVLTRDDRLSRRARARALGARGFLAFWQGDADAARTDLTAALDHFRGLDDDEGIAYCTGGLGIVENWTSGGTVGGAMLREAARRLDEHGDRWGAVMMQNSRNWASSARVTSSALPESEHDYRSTLDQAEAIGAPHQIALARANLGRYHIGRGEAESALPHLNASLQALVRIRHKGGLVYLLDALAEASLLLGEAEHAVRLLAAAETVRDAIGAPAFPAARERNRRNLEAAKANLDDDRFHEAWIAGAAMSLDEAAAEARAVQPRTTTGLQHVPE